MDLDLIATDEVFSIRCYDPAHGPAAQQYAARRDFNGVCMVMTVDDDIAVIKLALSRAPVTRGTVLSLCRTLHDRGIRTAIISRSGLHGGAPFTHEITDGILAGKRVWDIPAILAGAGGTY